MSNVSQFKEHINIVILTWFFVFCEDGGGVGGLGDMYKGILSKTISSTLYR